MAKAKAIQPAADQARAAARPPREERELITPEGVDLRLKLGDAGERAAGFLLDALIMVVVWILLQLLVGSLVFTSKGATQDFLAVIWLAAGFVLRNLYFIGFELGPGGATPGKRILGLRVASRNGGRLTSDAIFARNFMRELEFFLPASFLLYSVFAAGGDGADWMLSLLGLVWCGVFLFFPLFNRDRLRVGDLVAGTWVVKAPRLKLLADLSAAGQTHLTDFRFTSGQLDAYGVHELHVLEDVLRRNDRRTLQAVAERIRNKIGWTRGDEHDADFLSAYYAALRGRLESRLLLGKRKKDKFDV
jgi:uncharacterized RDD family membrane protein YckC